MIPVIYHADPPPSNLIELYELRIKLLRGTILGFATNGTQCKCCMMGHDCAVDRLKADDKLAGVEAVELHKPGCLCRDNIVGRHECDCGGR